MGRGPAVPAPPTVGGQAVIEGVMVRGPSAWAVAVRRPDGSVVVRAHDLPDRRWARVPILRGVVALGQQLRLGLTALHWSASVAEGREGGAPPTRGQLVATAAASITFFAVVFLLVPAVVAEVAVGGDDGFVFHLVEGGLRAALFVAYVAFIGTRPGIRRVFEYHGAEHKAIASYEAGDDVSPERAAPYSTIHGRCGTTFLVVLLIVAIVVNAVVGRPSWPVLVASRLLLVPAIAGLAYELIRLGANRARNPLVRVLVAPGLALQRLTTREPSADQLEVAVAALRAAVGPAPS